jgi:hypothetical protein
LTKNRFDLAGTFNSASIIKLTHKIINYHTCGPFDLVKTIGQFVPKSSTLTVYMLKYMVVGAKNLQPNKYIRGYQCY